MHIHQRGLAHGLSPTICDADSRDFVQGLGISEIFRKILQKTLFRCSWVAEYRGDARFTQQLAVTSRIVFSVMPLLLLSAIRIRAKQGGSAPVLIQIDRKMFQLIERRDLPIARGPRRAPHV